MDKPFKPNQFGDLFPFREISIGTKSIKVFPIPLPVIKDAITKCIGALDLTDAKVSVTEIGKMLYSLFSDNMQICLEVDIDTLPGTVLPQLLEAMIELNIGESVLKNWKALAEKVKQLTPETVEGN
jgi:hypothetical protein